MSKSWQNYIDISGIEDCTFATEITIALNYIWDHHPDLIREAHENNVNVQGDWSVNDRIPIAQNQEGKIQVNFLSDLSGVEITLDRQDIASTMADGMDGSQIDLSLVRTLIHELQHIADNDLVIDTQEYMSRKIERVYDEMLGLPLPTQRTGSQNPNRRHLSSRETDYKAAMEYISEYLDSASTAEQLQFKRIFDRKEPDLDETDLAEEHRTVEKTNQRLQEDFPDAIMRGSYDGYRGGSLELEIFPEGVVLQGYNDPATLGTLPTQLPQCRTTAEDLDLPPLN